MATVSYRVMAGPGGGFPPVTERIGISGLAGPLGANPSLPGTQRKPARPNDARPAKTKLYAHLIGNGRGKPRVFPPFDLVSQPLEAGGHHKQSGTHFLVSRAKRELPQPCGTFEVSLRPQLLLGYRHSLQPSQRVARSALKVRAEGASRRCCSSRLTFLGIKL